MVSPVVPVPVMTGRLVVTVDPLAGAVMVGAGLGAIEVIVKVSGADGVLPAALVSVAVMVVEPCG